MTYERLGVEGCVMRFVKSLAVAVGVFVGVGVGGAVGQTFEQVEQWYMNGEYQKAFQGIQKVC